MTNIILKAWRFPAATVSAAALTLIIGLAAAPGAQAGELVANPEAKFEKGMKWIERNGTDKGALQLNPSGTALLNWNGTNYQGKWEKVDEYHVRTMWKNGGPAGSVWSLRESGDPGAPYVISRRAP
jgi:hypothetical protein